MDHYRIFSPRVTSLVLGVIILVVQVLLSPRTAAGHGFIDDQIKEVSSRIKADPRVANLYFKRGELYRIHKDWPGS